MQSTLDTARLQQTIRDIGEGTDPRACLDALVNDDASIVDVLRHLQSYTVKIGDPSTRRSVADRLFRAFPNSVSCIDLYCRIFADALSAERLIELRAHAVSLTPKDHTVVLRLADAYERAGDPTAAAGVLRAATGLGIADEFLRFKLGYYLALTGKHEEALVQYKTALRSKVAHRTLLNMAVAYRQIGDLDSSAAASSRAIQLEPGTSDAYYNFANLQRERGDPAAAAQFNSRAEMIDPNNYAVKWNLSHALLAQGQFVRGFLKYKQRWAFRGFPTRVRYKGVSNIARLSDVSGSVFLYTEQGKGDNVLFCRFLPAFIAALPADTTCTVECFPELISLFRSSFPGVTFVEYARKLPADYDYYLPIFDIPEVLGLDRVDDISFPYLKPSTGKAASIPQTVSPKVGIAWAGNPDFVHDSHRSARLDDLENLLADGPVSFFSFQKGEDEALVTGRHPHVVDLAPQLQSFEDTAKLMDRMDFVISTCTSTANLAGALGKPGFTLVGHMRDWRWMTGSRSDWYPSMRILEKPRTSTWKDFLSDVRNELLTELGVH